MKYRVFKAWFLCVGILCSFSFSWAAEPDGYYQSAYGKSGYTLKTELANIISKNHSVVSYDGLWEAFKSTDARSNGKVWDMYSNCDFTFGEDKCGNYKDECDCYNREHSFPKSWFNDGKPMYSDLFHLYPTDGKVNGMRGNHPFGEVSNPTYTSHNGSKLGKNTTSGYSGTVFEPIDEYKGDFARSYFYMVTRYENQVGNWNSDMLESGNKTRAFKPWAVDLLLKWHRQDPVSDKEIKRNDAVYAQQHNRNPFIDYPELVEKIWGGDNTAFNPGGTGEPEDSTTYTTYEIKYKYYDAKGILVPGSDHTLTVKIPDSKKAAKAGEETVIFDEDFPKVNAQKVDDGTEATIDTTGAEYVEAFDGKVFLSGKSAVRLASSGAQGSVVFKEFNVNGEFSVSISGKGWGASETGFTLKCEGCTQESQTISFTKSKEDLSALDEYETLEPVNLTANGKARLTITAAKKQRIILDRVKVVSGNGGDNPDDPDDPDDPDNPDNPDDPDDPDDPDLTDTCRLKVLYPVAGDTVRKAAVTGRVAIVDKDGKELARDILKTVELPDTGNYSLWTNFRRGEDDLGEQTTPFVYALPNSGDPNVGVETLSGAEFRMYPNPTSGTFVLEMTSDDNLVEIFSVKGSLVLRRKHAGKRFETTLTRQGVYFVRVTNVYGGAVRRIVVM